LGIISKEEFSSATKLDKLRMPGLSYLLMELMKINDVNKLYSKYSELDGLSFVDAILDSLGITIEYDENTLKNIPKEGAFIAIANHPFGGIEGLILLKMLAKVRPDVKLMANFILKKIPNLSEHFIAVNPFENISNNSSISGIKSTLELLNAGSPIGIFPAGEVSAFDTKTQKVMDKQWNPVVGKLISKSKVPVLPIYFHGNNGLLFNILGIIHPTLRTAKLPSELFNKKGYTIKMRIGKAIQPNELKQFSSNEKLLTYLRARTYALRSGISSSEVKKFFGSKIFKIYNKPQAIVQETSTELIEKEIEVLRSDKHVMSEKNYDVFLSSAASMPNIMNEIGRLREITFREVGEGTNKEIDLDEYDFYYNHLFIWDREAKKIVGAYRVGKGDEIYFRYGIKGFYISNLFKIKSGFHNVMKSGLELGRSFIRKEYQQKPLPLFLLWKGLLIFIIKNPSYRYMFGPVSISNNFTKLSKKLMIEFIRKNCYNHDLAKFISPKKKFEAELDDLEIELLESHLDSIKSLDNLISEIEINHNKVPVLLRQYIQLNAQIIGFNVDPKFNDSLDGFLLLDIKAIPEETIKMLGKNIN
jgi:putative hemolysin